MFYPPQVLIKRRLSPKASAGDGKKPSGSASLVLGTLSSIVGYPINGYLPMPNWCTVQPDGSVREPPKEEPRSLVTPSKDVGRGDGNESEGGDSDSEFYSGSSPEASSEAESDSESDDSNASGSESVSGSESSSESVTESESGSESESESATDDESGSSATSTEESSSDESTESSATKGEEGVGLLIMGPGVSNTGATYGASAPAPQSQDLTGLVERMSVGANREDSSSPQLETRAEGLGTLTMAGFRGPTAAQMGVRPAPSMGRVSSVSSDLSVDPEGDTSVSYPTTLLRHQAGGGLQVDYQYTRGRATSVSRPSTTLILRLTLTNHRDTPIRRIRVMAPRDKTPMDCFPEVQILAAGAATCVNLGIDFGGRTKEVRCQGGGSLSALNAR